MVRGVGAPLAAAEGIDALAGIRDDGWTEVVVEDAFHQVGRADVEVKTGAERSHCDDVASEQRDGGSS